MWCPPNWSHFWYWSAVSTQLSPTSHVCCRTLTFILGCRPCNTQWCRGMGMEWKGKWWQGSWGHCILETCNYYLIENIYAFNILIWCDIQNVINCDSGVIKPHMNMVPPQLDMTVLCMDMTEPLCRYNHNMIGCWDIIPLSLGWIWETYCNQLFRHVLIMYLTRSCVLTPDAWQTRGWPPSSVYLCTRRIR